MELNKENVKKILGIITFTLVLYFILKNISEVAGVFGKLVDVISPFLLGMILAFILNIPMNFFENKFFKSKKLKNGKIKKSRIKRPFCIILSILVIVLIICLIIKLIIPQLISIIIMFAKNIPVLANDVKNWALDVTSQYPDISKQIQNININWDKVVRDALNLVGNLSKNIVTSSVGFVAALFGGIINGIVGLVFAIYILNGKEKLGEQIKKLMKAYLAPEKVENILNVARLSKTTFQNFITGQCTEAIILAILCCIGMLIFRLPYAITISVLIGVTALIPIVGAYIGAIIGAVLILSVDPIKSVVFILYIIVLQQVESNAIYPKVVGNSVGLPGIWVLLAVMVGGSLGGVLGLLIALPTASVLYAILRNKVNEKLETHS